MSTTVKSKRNSTSDQENSLSDVESEKQPVSSNEETENQDDDTDGNLKHIKFNSEKFNYPILSFRWR